MGWGRQCIEWTFKGLSLLYLPFVKKGDRKVIWLLRNNDLGDVLMATPLLYGLKQTFPDHKVVAAVGPWAVPLLENNPSVDEIMPVSAPWHNKQTQRYSQNTLRGLASSLVYLMCSSEVSRLRSYRAAIGIDVLGSPPGALMMLIGGTGHLYGVRGYAGGESLCDACIDFRDDAHVASSALGFLDLLGVRSDFPTRPRIYLKDHELQIAETVWLQAGTEDRRLLLAPGAGLPDKAWPERCFRRVLESLETKGIRVILVGSSQDRALCGRLAAGLNGVTDLGGKTNLRETLGLVATGSDVICNSSFIMHAAAAFSRPTMVCLGPSLQGDSDHMAKWGHAGQVHVPVAPGEADEEAQVHRVLEWVNTGGLG